jgi:hypothetical protein
MDKEMHAWYKKHPFHISRACRKAIVAFAKGIRGGRVKTEIRSRFLDRVEKADKIERSVMITGYDRAWLVKMAFMLCISQAEVLRMALEWWREVMDPVGRRYIARYARKKWHHSVIQHRATGVRFCLWAKDRMILNHFPTQQEAAIGIKATTSTCTEHFIIRGNYY